MNQCVEVNIEDMIREGHISRRLFQGVLCNELKGFIEYGFGLIYPEQGFVDNWHIDTIAYELERIARGQNKRLIITIPPRHLKSFMASVAFPTWLLGNWPDKKVICASYSAELSNVQTRLFRSLVAHERYQRLFPNMRIRQGANTETEQGTMHNGSRVATSVGGTLTGRGGDV